MKLEEIVEHLIKDCEMNIKVAEDGDYITINYETIKKLEKVKTLEDLLKIFDKDYILWHFDLNSLEEIKC
jgi:uncharacterized protein YjgD (DUF1641 family)